MIEAWLSASEITASSAPSSVSKRPPLASKQELNRIVSSVPRKADSRTSSSRVRLRAADEPYRRRPVAPPLKRFVGSRDDGRVVGETE